MTSPIRYGIIAVITVGILLLLALTHSSPLLYALEKDFFPSPFHENPDVLKQQSLNSTTDVLPELQDFIDFTGPVSLNIRIRDLEQARRDLERFQKSHGSIKNLIVKLDMNESEIAEIEKNTALQREILESLMNTSVSLESLELMEIEYRSQNNADMLTTVRLQGNELRKKVKGLNTKYQNATEKVVASGKKFGLNTTKTEESAAAVNKIVEEIEQPLAEERRTVDVTNIPGEERVSLFIKPDKGEFQDIIEYMGISLTLEGNTTQRSGGKQIIIYMDDKPVSTIMTDNFGFYRARLPIDRTKAGEHIVFVRSPTARSMNRTLTVIAADSVTNLSVTEPDDEGRVNCTGSVTGKGYPVRSGSVQIVWDETHVIVTKTDAKGMFSKELVLPEGRHTIIAHFYGDGYPLNPSQSTPQIVEISFMREFQEDFGWIWIVVVAAVLFSIFTAGAYYYLKRMTVPRAALHPAEPACDLTHSLEDLLEPEPGSIQDLLEDENETLFAYYTRVMKEKGLSTASRKVYEHLASHIARDFRIKRYRTMTAREMQKTCRGRPYCNAFARFVSVYERVRYGGQASTKDQAVFEAAMDSTENLMGGDDH